MKEIDLHQFRNLFGAKTVIIERLIDSFHSDEIGLIFIHGNNNGIATRNYLRSPKLIQDAQSSGLNGPINVIPTSKGRTSILFN